MVFGACLLIALKIISENLIEKRRQYQIKINHD